MKTALRFSLLLVFLLLIQAACGFWRGSSWSYNGKNASTLRDVLGLYLPQDSIHIRNGTFLGNEKRNYYGDSAPARLDLIWKHYLGGGKTVVTPAKGTEEWFGAGWTGQPLVVQEHNHTFLLQGAFDHHLKKINATTGELVWQYEYDDILKGTGTIWVNDSASNPLNRILILQGSRKGFALSSPFVGSYRAVSYFTGEEVWRMNVEQTASYSRDVDASALIFADTAYIGLENGKFISFDPGRKLIEADTVNFPRIYNQTALYRREDILKHGGNLVTEASPVRIGNHVYLASGSGHVYGYNLDCDSIDWDFFIGSDMDGTPVVSSDSCLIVTVEKQYIEGSGGVFKLNPRRNTNECVDWYFPTGDFDFSSWKGGVIGSVSVNDAYNADGMYPKMAAFTGIDGYLNVVDYAHTRKDTTVLGPDGKTTYSCPKLLFRSRIGPSISTPLFVQDKLIAAGYGGINLFQYNRAAIFDRISFHSGIFEATPIADQGKIYVAARDGFLYCFGEGEENLVVKTAIVPKEVKAATEHKPIAKPVSEIAQGRFYLIAGAFRMKENALASVKQWQKKGVQASIIESPANLWYVSVASYSTREKADESRADFLQKQAVDVWVYGKE
jgi:outer membrane protein assembly factor BamB